MKAVLNDKFDDLVECIDFMWENRKTVTYEQVIEKYDSLSEDMFEYLFVKDCSKNYSKDDTEYKFSVKAKVHLMPLMLKQVNFYEEFVEGFSQ